MYSNIRHILICTYLVICFHGCNIAECRTGSGSSGLSYDQEEERDDAKIVKLRHYGNLYKIKYLRLII